jgi:hypothetical protein
MSTWHLGALDGTSTLLVRRFDDFNWAVLFNTCRSGDGNYLAGILDPLMHPVIDQLTNIPDTDQFESLL